jgi:hypothetical protein
MRTRIKLFMTIVLGLGTVTIDGGMNRLQVVSAQHTEAQQDKPFDQQQKLDELMQKIAGQENKPAEEVFKNIQMMKGMPAARLLRVMNLGYSKSLGVDCTHCHLVDQWEKDDKPTKPIAREMMKMVKAINDEHLKNIPTLKGPNPVVNCTTCHRGQTKPALQLPEAGVK